MGKADTPIVAGAQYEDVNDEIVRVKSVWVDEDLTTQIAISHGETAGEPKKPEAQIREIQFQQKTIDLETFVLRIESTDFERVNTDHEAWKWRKE